MFIAYSAFIIRSRLNRYFKLIISQINIMLIKGPIHNSTIHYTRDGEPFCTSVSIKNVDWILFSLRVD